MVLFCEKLGKIILLVSLIYLIDVFLVHADDGSWNGHDVLEKPATLLTLKAPITTCKQHFHSILFFF